jgi:Escherichia/Staphylococcus phage prohead protease
MPELIPAHYARLAEGEEQIERRLFPLRDCRIETRANPVGDGDEPIFRGYAAVWDELSVDLGGFREIVRSSAFDNSLATSADVRFLINHDSNMLLGRSGNAARQGTLTLAKDEYGLLVECPLPDTSYARDLAVSMQRGDIDQMSFGFKAREDSWRDTDKASGLPIRDLLRADLFDVSVVTFPAYPVTTAEVRALARFAAEGRERIELPSLGELRSVAAMQDFPLAPRDRAWSASEAEARIRSKTGAEDAPNASYARCFMWHDADNADNFTAYKLLYCDVIDDEIRAVPRGIFAIAGVLNGARGGADLAGEEDDVKSLVERWYGKMRKAFDDDSIQVPWAENNSVRNDIPGLGELPAAALRALAELDPAEVGEELIEQVRAELEERAGKTLSAKNREALSGAVDSMQSAMEAIQSLLDATQDEIPSGGFSSDPGAGAVERQGPMADAVARLRETVPEEARELLDRYSQQLAAEGRSWQWDDDYQVWLLTQMISYGSTFLVSEEQEESEKSGTDSDAMTAIMTALAGLLASEIGEAAMPPTPTDGARSKRRRLALLELETAGIEPASDDPDA